MSDKLKEKTVNAVIWTAVDRFGQQIFQFVIGLILANKLFPEDYGLLAMATIFSALSSVLIDGGFGQALIRKRDADEMDFNTVFYFNIVVSVLFYAVIFFCAPYIAFYFNEPQLIAICRIVSIGLLFNAIYLVPYIQKVKDMDYKSVAKVNIFATVLSGTLGVSLVYLKMGVWALVFQQISSQFFRMIGYSFIVRWQPRLMFSISVIRGFMGFSMGILGTTVLNVAFNNIYNFVFGKWYGKTSNGYYTQANKLSETFNFTFQQIVLGSTYSMFSQIHDETERFRRILGEVTRKTAVVAIPVVMVLIAVAKPMIFVLLKEKWMPAAPYFQLLCVAAVFVPFYSLNVTALNTKGLSRLTFIIEGVKKVLILLSLFVFYSYGIKAMLMGYALVCFVSYLISVVYIQRNTLQPIFRQIRDLIPGVIIGSFLALVVFGLSFLISNNFILLSIQLPLVAVSYVLLIKKFQPELYNQVLEFISQKMRVLRKNPA